jgi:Zn-dependent alcohol dehydrogenase
MPLRYHPCLCDLHHAADDDIQFIPQLIDLHRQGKFPVEKICKVYPAAEIKQAISDMEAGRVSVLLCCIGCS